MTEKGETKTPLRIKKVTSPKDTRNNSSSVRLVVDGEVFKGRHPIFDFNYNYASAAIFKRENIQNIKSRADVMRLVGYPLLQAALHLYDLGIELVDSSPYALPGFIKNKPAGEFFSYIDIGIDSLTAENQIIAEKLVTNGKAQKIDASYHLFNEDPDIWVYRLLFPISDSITAEEMDTTTFNTAKLFKLNHKN